MKQVRGGACESLRKCETNLTGPGRLEAKTRETLTFDAKSSIKAKISRLHYYKYARDSQRIYIRCLVITGSRIGVLLTAEVPS